MWLTCTCRDTCPFISGRQGETFLLSFARDWPKAFDQIGHERASSVATHKSLPERNYQGQSLYCHEAENQWCPRALGQHLRNFRAQKEVFVWSCWSARLFQPFLVPGLDLKKTSSAISKYNGEIGVAKLQLAGDVWQVRRYDAPQILANTSYVVLVDIIQQSLEHKHLRRHALETLREAEYKDHGPEGLRAETAIHIMWDRIASVTDCWLASLY